MSEPVWKPIETAPKGTVTLTGYLGEGAIIAISDGNTLALVTWNQTYVPKPEYENVSYYHLRDHMMMPSNKPGYWSLVHAGAYCEDGDPCFKPTIWADPIDLLPKG
jgi:hypothetical protein